LAVMLMGMSLLVTPIDLQAEDGEEDETQNEQQARLAQPSAELQAARRKDVQQLYSREIAAARQPNEARIFAQLLLGEGRQLRNDPSGQFVLFDMAREFASRGGDYNVAFQAVDAMDELFEVSARALKAQSLPILMTRIRGADEALELAHMVRDLIETGLVEEDYSSVREMVTPAIRIASRAEHTSTTRRITALSRYATEAERSYIAANTARIAENRSPEDSLAIGRYLCFFKGDWDEGLPHLVAGSDPLAAEAARLELDQPETPTGRVEIAEAWWQIGARERDRLRDNIIERAELWYRRALVDIDGLEKRRIERRLAEISSTGVRMQRRYNLNNARALRDSFLWAGRWSAGRDGASAVIPEEDSIRGGNLGRYIGWIETQHHFEGDCEMVIDLRLGRSRYINTGRVYIQAFGEQFDLRSGNQWRQADLMVHFERRGSLVRWKIGNDPVQQRTLDEKNWYKATPVRLYFRDRRSVRIVSWSVDAVNATEP